jgi:hypothetical protein
MVVIRLALAKTSFLRCDSNVAQSLKP